MHLHVDQATEPPPGCRLDDVADVGPAQTSPSAGRGVEGERLWAPKSGTAAGIQSWFARNVTPRLEQGEGAQVAISGGVSCSIVRLESVETDGLRVRECDTPGKGHPGATLWEWAFVAACIEYVQFWRVGG